LLLAVEPRYRSCDRGVDALRGRIESSGRRNGHQPPKLLNGCALLHNAPVCPLRRNALRRGAAYRSMPRHSSRKESVMRPRRSSALLGLLALSGCAAVSTAGGERLRLGSDGFRGYVERVFREQNRVADELAFAAEAPGPARAALAAAEDELLAACAGVNELATARRDGRRLGIGRSVRLAQSVPQCERATEAALQHLAR
jgi:hypothetical protein